VKARRLAVYGAGGHGKVVADVARSAGWSIECFVDDASARAGATFFGAPVLSWEALLALGQASATLAIALGIGDNPVRARIFDKVQAAGFSVPVMIHGRATVAPTATLMDGTVVMAGAVVNPDARVGVGAILNTGSVVEHDCELGRFVHLSPNSALGGAAHVGDFSHVGLGGVVLPGIRVGAGVRVGAGAAVIRDVPDGLTVVGVPARPVRSPRGEGGVR
jgi:sugar O-acyltransferase (sialic acid O-acetyltransferase NeuD family)